MAYDSAISSFTTKTNKVDLVDAAHMNTVQSELVTIETILGTGLKGTAASLSARLNKMMDSDGSILSGTSFPSPSLATQGYYRTDLDVFYIMNAGNSAWIAQGGSLSNVLFQYQGYIEQSAAGEGEYSGTSLLPSAVQGNYRFLQNGPGSGTYGTVWTSKFTKISGIATVTVYVRIWQAAAQTASLKVDIGGQNSEVTGTSSQTTPEWKSFTINVTSLVNGTVYDVTASLKNSSNGEYSYCSDIVAFGS